MTEHQRETAFLKHLILFDGTDERRELETHIAQVQRDERCIRRAVSLIVLFMVLGAAGLAYGKVFQENFPYGEHWFVFKLIFELGLASLICLVALAGLLMAYRRKLNRLREECRRLVTKLLETHLGSPQATPWRDGHVETGDRGLAQGAVEANVTPHYLDSLPGVHSMKQTHPVKQIPARE